MKQPTLQTQYNLITEGKGNKFAFLREAKTKFPGYVPNSANFDQAVNILKTKNILNENYVDLQPIAAWDRKEESYETAFKNFLKEEETKVKANSKKVAKEVEETQDSNYSNDDVKNLDNQIGQEVLNGIAFEARKNPDKTLDEIRAIVSKNLAKDKLYYLKNAAFGVEGIGYTEDVPGFKPSKSDQMQKVKLNESKKPSIDDHLIKIEKAGEMATLEAKINAVDEAMKKRQERIDMIGENEDLADLVNPAKLKEMQREIKLLEKQKNKLEKIYQKITGKKKQEVVDEIEVEPEELNEELEADVPLKKYEFEIYTKDPDTGEEGWDIEFVLIIAENYKEAVKRLKTYDLFDTIITKNYLGDISKGDMDSEEYKAYENMVISDKEF